MLVQTLVKRSRKMVKLLACRDPTEDVEAFHSSPVRSDDRWWDIIVDEEIDDQMLLSQCRGAPEPSQDTQQSRPMPRRGSRKRQPRVVRTPGTGALGPPRKGKTKRRNA